MTKKEVTAKTTETGSIKDPNSGSTLAANASDPTANKTASKNQPTVSPKDATNKTVAGKAPSEALSPAAKAQNDSAPKDTRPLDKNITELKGEILQGDSFRLSFKRGDVSFQIPVPMETNRDVVTLDNTLRIIDEIQKAEHRDELNQKFASYIVT